MHLGTHQREATRPLPAIDQEPHARIQTATFAVGCFWGPDARFGRLPGVVRTRVGYAGGSTADPTYSRIGDHTETFQVDFDPDVIAYEKLLEVFWSEHDPAGSRGSTQYAHVAFWHDEEQRAAIAGSRRAIEDRLGPGKSVTTQVVPLERFYVAEDYHQKHRLRGNDRLMSEFAAMYATPSGFRDSTAAARVNGYLGGSADTRLLLSEVGSYGLSQAGEQHLLKIAGSLPTGDCSL